MLFPRPQNRSSPSTQAGAWQAVIGADGHCTHICYISNTNLQVTPVPSVVWASRSQVTQQEAWPVNSASYPCHLALGLACLNPLLHLQKGVRGQPGIGSRLHGAILSLLWSVNSRHILSGIPQTSSASSKLLAALCSQPQCVSCDPQGLWRWVTPPSSSRVVASRTKHLSSNTLEYRHLGGALGQGYHSMTKKGRREEEGAHTSFLPPDGTSFARQPLQLDSH